MNDQIVSEVREMRREIEDEYGNDPKKYFAHLRRAQKKYGKRLVRLEPRISRKRKVA